MPNLIEFKEKLFAHDFQGAHLPRVFLCGKIDLSISTLSDLRQDLKIAVSKSCTSLPQICALSAQVFVLCGFVFRF